MAPYEALYGRPCRTPLCWTEVGESRDLDPEMVQETKEQVELLRQKLKEAHDRQKSWADKRRRDLEFAVGDLVYLKMRTFRGNADKNRKLKKLKPRYLGPYQILERIGSVAYRLDLPHELGSIHDVFHVSALRKAVREPELIISQPPENLEGNLSVRVEPLDILSRREAVRNGKMIQEILVSWAKDGIQEETWESEHSMIKDYPELFMDEGNHS